MGDQAASGYYSTVNQPIEATLRDLTEPLTRYLRRYCGDPEVARDLVQETLLRVTRALPGFSGKSSLKTWVFSIATRVAADHFRRLSRSLPAAGGDDDLDTLAAEHTLEQQLIVDEMNACVRGVIDELPGDYRAALVLRDLEGLSVAEVADVCGCSLASAKIRIHRARRRLQAALNEGCDFYQDSDDVMRCDRKQI
jgi:RNA polymerase sigma-70 factor (ECF subfamily)